MITSKAEYLLRILMHLAEESSKGPVTSGEIAARQGIPPKYIPQLMAMLTKKGWVSSQRGARGGVKLVADPAFITVREVIRLAQGDLLMKDCLDPAYPCDRRRGCPLLPIWIQAQENVDEIMGKTTIADLVMRHKPAGGARALP
ncbi:MAG: Rrf2 family transcriptional regulator [Firmicutes bacterium]|nr:Rrf2 family transcriptional regulator [Candidatus Fermentithermobacillaceae bacterium]